MECDYEYIIAGNPMPQLRHRARYQPPRGKKKGFVQTYDEAKCRKEKQHIAALIKKSTPPSLLDCPLQVDLIFYMQRPLSHYGTGCNSDKLKPTSPKRHTKAPDIDNLRKLVMDALTGVVWRDDSIVCKGTTIKQYSERPRTEIFIKIIQESEATLWQKKQENS